MKIKKNNKTKQGKSEKNPTHNVIQVEERKMVRED